MNMNVNAYLRKLDKSTLVMTWREWLARVLDWLAEHTTPDEARAPVPSAHAIHPRRAHVHELRGVGAHAADRVSAVMGSWRYLILQNVIIGVWMTVNAIGVLSLHWDPYPFILLNLAMSWFAANSTPILQMSGNRSAARDRARDDTEAHEVDELLSMNRQQLEILRGQDEQMARQQQTIELLHQLIAEQRKGRSAHS